jgi:hypothetical protein
MLLEDLTRVANGVQSRIEMCTNWTETAVGSGWQGGFPVQVNGVAFETNRYMNVVGYRVYAEDGAFIEELTRNPQGGLMTNTVRRFIANEPGMQPKEVSLDCYAAPAVIFSSFPDSPPGTTFSSNVFKTAFSASAEWRWAGRTYTNSVTVPRMIVLYNRN